MLFLGRMSLALLVAARCRCRRLEFDLPSACPALLMLLLLSAGTGASSSVVGGFSSSSSSSASSTVSWISLKLLVLLLPGSETTTMCNPGAGWWVRWAQVHH
jgi:hypothetical protein